VCAAAALVTGAGIALARTGVANGPTGALAAVAGVSAGGTTAGPALLHVLQTKPSDAARLVTVPDLPTTEAAPIERPAEVPALSAESAPPASTPEPVPPAETGPAAPAPAPEPASAELETAAPPLAAAPPPDTPVVAPYSTVVGWHGPDRVAYLTFDDGPGPATGRVLDVLAATGVKATFCQIGLRVTENPGISARVAAEGHTLCNHSWDHHSPFDALAPQTLDQEIALTQNAIQQAAGVTPRYLRAPEGRFGEASGAVFQAGQRARTIPLGWGVDSLDWKKPGTAGIVANVLSAVSPGAIILLHDGGGDREETIAALPAIITGLQAAGYTLAAMPTDPGG
jgi:peptidoglycan/xylan/chitin deacetylase (PgdA/CDA1 family)